MSYLRRVAYELPLSRTLLCLLLFLLCSRTIPAQNVTVTNVFQNHYHYGYPIGDQNCPSGYNIPSGQYSSTFHLERGHAIHHADPQNASNDYWVYWAHLDNSSYGIAEIAVFKSTTQCGPYYLQTQLSNPNSMDGYGYGFRPGGWEARDDNIFLDNNQTYNSDGTVASYASAYLIAASNDQHSISGESCSAYANNSMAIFKMTSDYLGIDTTTNTATNGANWVFVCAQREAPVMFKKGGTYFLITSQAAGWYPSQGGYGVSTNALTGWSTSPLNLGNTSTYGGQTSDGFTIHGTQDNAYILTFDHLGGDDSKNPAYTGERRDTGEIWLPVLLDENAKTATLNWYSSWTVNNTTGVLTLPTLTNLATGATPSSTVTSAATSGTTTYTPSNAIDGVYTTRWTGSASGASSFNAATPTGTALCPVTGATSTTTCNPSLIIDMGSIQPVQQIDLSFYMVKGSEPYYTFKIAYSSDGSTWTTKDYTSFASASNAAANNIGVVPFSNNIMYGFNSLPVNFSARYVALMETSVVQQNSTSPFYAPNVFEMAIIKSTAPTSPQSVTVTVTPSTATPDTGASFSVGVTVSGPNGYAAPTGYVQLSAPGYASEIYGLVNGASSYTIPAGALQGGLATLTVNYRPDPTSAPLYGIGTTSGTANVTVSAPYAPANLTATQSQPNAITLSWTASVGATSYVLKRSTDGGSTYTQLATPSATSYTDTGLTNDSISYCYMVAGVNSAGAGSYSAPVCKTATASFPVSGVAVTQSGPGALTISYTALSNATSYIINRSVAGGSYSQLTTLTGTSYTDTGLTPGSTNYCYTVAAVFSTGTAAAGSAVCNTASNAFAPTNIAVSKWKSGALRLTWQQNGSAASTYTVKRAVSGGSYTTIATGLTLPQYTDTAVTNGTTYCYTVAEVLNAVSSPDATAVCNTAIGSFLSVPNSSFETPDETTALWGTGPTSLPASTASWTFVGATGSSSGNNSGISIQTSGTWAKGNGGGSGTAPDGKQVAYVESSGSITQAVSGFTTGQTYTIMVAASQRQSVSQTANPFQIVVNDTVLGAFTPAQSNPYYVDYSATFTASSASNTIAFVGTSTSGTSAVLLDNVRIFLSSAGN